jgi:hypothetical protein
VSEVKCSGFCRTVCFQSLYLPSFLPTYISQKPDFRITDFFKKSVHLTQKILHVLLRPVGSDQENFRILFTILRFVLRRC